MLLYYKTNPEVQQCPNTPRVMPADKQGRSPAYLRQGYKAETRVRFMVDPDTGLLTPCSETEHWDGSQDARVVPRTFKLKIRP